MSSPPKFFIPYGCYRYAGIECKEVEGRAKAIRYRAGDGDSDYIRYHRWIAFKADGKWHLMHPQWSIQALVGYEHGGEIEIERDGRESIRVRVEKEGKPMFMVNDFWFCTAPEVFVTRCFPDKAKWQNPDGNVLISTVKNFLSVPDLRQGFHAMKLFLLNEEQSCILQSKKGKCWVSVMSDKDEAKTLDFSYELAMEGTSGDRLKVKDLNQLVLPQTNKNVFKFEIRLPVVGTYWFRLAVGLVNEPYEKRNCCEFKITCKEACKKCRRIPKCEGLDAYGYGPQAEEAGLVHSSQTDAKINMEPSTGKSKQTIATFKTDSVTDPDMTYGAQMIACGSDEVDGSDIDILLGTTEVLHDKAKGELKVNASVPKEGEYAVVITAKDDSDASAKKPKPVAGYLVTTTVDEDDKKNNALVKQREKLVRCQNHRMAKIDERNKLADIIDATRTELNELKERKH